MQSFGCEIRCLLLLLTSFSGSVRAQLVINELMQSNIDCVMDDLNEFPDSWVELYNVGENTVNLKQYALGISDNKDDAYRLPDLEVLPHKHVLIYCDKEKIGCHTNFRLESGKGCSIYLFRDGEITDKVVGLQKQPSPNIAYGRKTDGSDVWGYQLHPTPNETNCDYLAKGVLGNPIFNNEGRVVTNSTPIILKLSLPTDIPTGTTIRYTLDGTEPTENSIVYLKPLMIDKTTIVRASLFCKGYLSSRSITHSYIFFPDTRPLTLPIISITTDNKYLYDREIGILVNGADDNEKKNYEYDWRRPVNFEYFNGADQESELNQLCETRITGGESRRHSLKSMVIYAHKRFGEKRLKYEFFPDQRPGLTEYKSIMLRNAGNDFVSLYMRDAIIQCTMGNYVDLDRQAWRPAIVYFNGKYKGILNIRERSNADNIYTNYDGLEDIDMMENWVAVNEGDGKAFDRFESFYTEHGHTLAEYSEWIDWKEFINLMAMNLYYNNRDFLGNNLIMWRPRKDGGKWRFIAKDTDFGLGLDGEAPLYKTLSWLYDPEYDPIINWGNTKNATRLFRRMMEDEDFKREFIDHMAVYMGDFLNERGTRAVWDPMYEMIKTEFPFFKEVVDPGRPWKTIYAKELSNARGWLAKRTDFFYSHLSEFFQLGKPIPLSVNQSLMGDDIEGMHMYINGVRLSKGTFDGQFFDGRKLTLEGLPSEQLMVKGWELKIKYTNGKDSVILVDGSRCSFHMPTCQKMTVNAVLSEVNGIITPDELAWRWRIEGNEIVISNVVDGMPVTLYDSKGVVLEREVSVGTDVRMALHPYKGQLLILKVGEKSIKIAY